MKWIYKNKWAFLSCFFLITIIGVIKAYIKFHNESFNGLFTFGLLHLSFEGMYREVLMAVKTSVLVFWVVTPCDFVGRYQRLGEQL